MSKIDAGWETECRLVKKNHTMNCQFPKDGIKGNNEVALQDHG